MKKIIFTIALLASFMCAANAQVNGNAIGVRFGYGGEISYQHALGNANRLEFDLGASHWGDNVWGINVTAIYQRVWDLSDLSNGFNWYAGVGGSAGLVSSNLGLGVVGQVGLEYNFNIPLQLSLDYRPILYILPNVAGGYDGICLGVRYKF